MPSLEILITFTLASLVLNLSPGPSNLYVMARAIAQGTRVGVLASCGLAVGSLVHVLATVLGLSVLFTHSPMLYTAVKLLGAAYLVYLGIDYWRSAPLTSGIPSRPLAQKSAGKVFAESILVEVTNPKTALFFIAFLPQFVVPEAGPVAWQLLLLGIIVTLSGLPCDMVIALSSSKAASWLLRHPGAQRVQQRVSGTLLLGMGAWIFVEEATAG